MDIAMSETANTLSTSAMDPAEANPGDARCRAAAQAVYDKLIANHRTRHEAQGASRKAYQRALPPLDTPANLRDFVACIAYGITHEMFYPDDSARLLYAAQIARNVQPPTPRPPSPSRDKEAEIIAKLLKFQNKLHLGAVENSRK